jgi:adenosylhomocysteine nucleosidase
MKRALIIAALPRELALLVSDWQRRDVIAQGRRVQVWESQSAIAACTGIGSGAARVATDAAFRFANGEVSLIISAGLAGAVDPSLGVADIIQPATVTDGVDGLSISAEEGEGLLVTSGAVATLNEKRVLRRTGAAAVDMEAFAVADVARIHGVPFIAIKSISDTADFELPPLGRFITPEGEFQAGRFALWTAFRPWSWLTVVQLGRNSGAAIRSLTQALENTLRNHPHHP